MIILLNGPPRCGKDTVSQLIFEKTRTFQKEKFSSHLKEVTHMLFGHPAPHDRYEHCKDSSHPHFNGMTPREAYIWVDTVIMKPHFGEDYLGERLASRIEGQECDFVVSDSGFMNEVAPVLDLVGPHNVIHVQIKRKGCDFRNDSRSYWKIAGLRSITVTNDHSLASLSKKVDLLLTDLKK